MQKAGSPPGRRWHLVFWAIALLVTTLDQLSKIWVRSNLATGESLPRTGLFQLTHVHNTGAAFGLFQGQSFLLTVAGFVSIGVVLFLVLWFSHRHFWLLDNRLSRIALGLILGGAVGNLVDRLRLGYVTDFIDIAIWPAFNIADSAITVGTIILAYSIYSLSRASKQ